MKRARNAASVEEQVQALAESLRGAGSNARKEKDRAYLKMPDRQLNYGVPVPAITSLAKQWYKEHSPPLQESAQLLWGTEEPVFEHRMAAVKLLRWQVKLLKKQDLALVERFLGEAGTWALVDELATSVAPAVIALQDDPRALLDRWSRRENFWLRRSCLLAHLADLRSGGGDWESFCGYATQMMGEKEFFIQKAIGWVLRDTSKKRKELVFKFVLKEAPIMSTTTFREAVKYLDAAQKTKVAAKRQ
jgi:3-methyladenine DNA glycosylase AlkD